MKRTRPPTLDEVAPHRSLDELCAWKHFGGLTVDAAFHRFLEHPMVYQEDFMFMGSLAFAHYLPVLERYLTTVEPVDPTDDAQAWILGRGCTLQLAQLNPWDPDHAAIIDRVLALRTAMLAHLEPRLDAPTLTYVREGWQDLVDLHGHKA